MKAYAGRGEGDSISTCWIGKTFSKYDHCGRGIMLKLVFSSRKKTFQCKYMRPNLGALNVVLYGLLLDCLQGMAIGPWDLL